MRFFGFVLTLIGVVYLLDLALLAGVHRTWWQHRWVRRVALLTPIAVAVGLGIWAASHEQQSTTWVAVGAGLTSIIFAQLAALLLALLLSAVPRGAICLWGVLRRGASDAFGRTVAAAETTPRSPDRRRFLRASLTAIPLATSSAAAGGTLQSMQRPKIPEIPLRYPDLPAALQGLRILHLSDLHVGPYLDLRDVARLLERAAALTPDLVLVTGDICDHMPDYLATLLLIETLAPPLGIYASLGNHEYFRGLPAVRACFARSSIPLLIDAGLSIPVGDHRLYVAGADDPRYLASPDAHARLRRSVESSLAGAPSNAFHLLMSHRSQAFDTAAPLGVHLTLSGHTHGFQMGFAGRSLLEGLLPQNYVWGHYGGGDTQLYTSAGVGHWFPFRLGCPPEAPLFTLTSATRQLS
ncbi:MAG: metallophosphoesterase [bacterium]|nr:metallophosphoesterase [bacterium]